jgi:hypothetical protein
MCAECGPVPGTDELTWILPEVTPEHRPLSDFDPDRDAVWDPARFTLPRWYAARGRFNRLAGPGFLIQTG